MKRIAKPFFSLTTLFLLLSGSAIYAQDACCGGEKHDETTCTADHSEENKSTVGCQPSSCRGAQTKFGEAKVLTDLRNDLVSLKSAINKNTIETQMFVGHSDEESLALMAKEIQSIEASFSTKFKTSFPKFALPENKAKQVSFLQARLEGLRKLL